MKNAAQRGTLDQVPLSSIVEHDGFNARGKYGHIEELAAHIEEHGLQQPLACYRLDVDEDHHSFGVLFLQSGYRRRRALEIIARKLDDPDMLVDVAIKTYPSHDAAMVPALAVDTMGEPLRGYDLAVRLTYLIDKLQCSHKEISRLTSVPPSSVSQLVFALKNLHPRIIKVWEKAPSASTEIPMYQLARWAREPQSQQMAMLEAYVNGDEIVDSKGRPKKSRNGERLDGKRTSRKMVRAELDRLHVRLEAGGKPIEIARIEGAVKGLRFALGDITKVF